jgi:DNA-binding response OmpR family regulator
MHFYEGGRVAALGEKRKILCVDDDLILAQLCEESLQELDYEVIGVADAERALRLFEENPKDFDLLIVDQIMPKVTGTGLAREALTIRPDVSVLLVTGHEGAVSEVQAREAGVREVLVKPLTTAELAAAIERVLA